MQVGGKAAEMEEGETVEICIFSIDLRAAFYFILRPKSKNEAILSKKGIISQPQGLGGNKTCPPNPSNHHRLGQPEKMCVC